MAMDGIMLSAVVAELKERLVQGRVDKVTQPEKDMVILQIRTLQGTVRLLMSASPDTARIHLTEESFVNPPDAPMFCMLMRKHIGGARILSVRQPSCDRVCIITLEGRDEMGDAREKELYLEIMGRHSNLTLVSEGRIVDAARHVSFEMSRVRQALPGLPFVPPPVQDKLDPLTASGEEIASRLEGTTGPLDKALSRVLCGLGASTAREMALRITGRGGALTEDEDVPALAGRLRAFLDRLGTLGQPCVLRDGDGLGREVLPFPFLSYPDESQQRFPDTGKALDAYYTGRDLRLRMEQKNASLRHTVRSALERSEKKLALQEEELGQSARMDEWRIFGELLTAQSYLIPKGAPSVTVQNYYDENGGSVTIPLDVSLSPAQNAQRYFRRYRKARSAMTLAAGQREKTLKEIAVLEQALEDLEKSETEDEIREVRTFLTENGILKPQTVRRGSRRPAVSSPHRFLSPDGLEILVGKNSMQNERLTRDARGDDLWLHAKDMPGSHVILRKGPGEAPKASLEAALKLAAFYSRGRGQHVSVDMTERRYVKKPGGTPAGFVTYTRQTTVIVSCTEGEIRAMAEKKA